ncbi:MAG: replication-associated recombination protein A [candidate division WOR-3 bacterium]|nr:replication-associated recombination protein A [candidate division WOR-3 bacterium]MDW7988305.1 replication-associated recombination protein A [candidate division WOR-3 bacterium]
MTFINSSTPLAERMRPQSLEDFVGQKHLLDKGKPLRTMIEKGELHSMILWGPPGSGKTTLAYLIAKYTKANFVSFSAVTSGVADIRKVISDAQQYQKMFNQSTVLFVDEIHRFNKAQQDAFLPYVEQGKIILIGATTENPSFEVTSPLLSRCRVYVLNQLTPDEIALIIKRAISAPQGLKDFNVIISKQAINYIINLSQGDARVALNLLELATKATEPDKTNRRRILIKTIEEIALRKILLYDKSGEEHYNLISALHKSLRDSDVDAALYWLARMIESGEDPLYIARRLVRFAVEDIGDANYLALVIAIAAKEAVEFIGRPEGDLALAQAVVYLAQAPKSNRIYKAYELARKDALESLTEPVPLHLRNPVTKLMKDLGYGKGYKYAHDFPNAKVNQEHFPPSLKGRKYYYPYPKKKVN